MFLRNVSATLGYRQDLRQYEDSFDSVDKGEGNRQVYALDRERYL